jgi:hypothetical protein
MNVFLVVCVMVLFAMVIATMINLSKINKRNQNAIDVILQRLDYHVDRIASIERECELGFYSDCGKNKITKIERSIKDISGVLAESINNNTEKIKELNTLQLQDKGLIYDIAITSGLTIEYQHPSETGTYKVFKNNKKKSHN